MTDKQAPIPVKSYEIRDLYEDLVKEHQIIFEYWLNPDYSAKALEDAGYKFFQLQRALDNGTINCWIHSSILNDQHVKNQTKDHYGTVMQIAAYLREKGFENVQVHHEGDADVTAELNGLSYAFEYERGRTHSISQIIDKNSRAKLLYDVVFFVCLQSNERTIKKAVGASNCRPRGFKLKDLIDSVTEGKYITEYQLMELKEPVISEIEAS